MLLYGNFFEHVDLNYNHQKHQTWYMSMKIFLYEIDLVYIVESVLKTAIQW